MALKEAFSGLDRPLYVAHTGDGTGDIYIVERAGKIKIARNGVIRPQSFLDVTARVLSRGSEQGLLGLAFHPNYRNNGYFYVTYNNRDGAVVLARFTAPGDRSAGDPASEKQLIVAPKPFDNHNGGQVAFGPDGMLWFSLGDGGSGGDPFGNGQNIQVILGKLMRIDVDKGDPYAIPPDNPFVGNAGARGEIWAFGLRNPWRFSFDRLTGDLYIGDVGQSNWEEVDFVQGGSRGGLNFGWNRMEGTRCFTPRTGCDATGLVLPVAEYATGSEGCAVLGGYVYRGKQFPAMIGRYFFSDHCSGAVWSLTRDTSGAWVRTQVIPPPPSFAGLSSFGEDEAGELYITALNSGKVYQLVQAED